MSSYLGETAGSSRPSGNVSNEIHERAATNYKRLEHLVIRLGEFRTRLAGMKPADPRNPTPDKIAPISPNFLARMLEVNGATSLALDNLESMISDLDTFA